MFAIATLTFEHRVMQRALVALERLVEEIASGLDGRTDVLKLVGFLNAYIQEIHQPKEVDILVARLVEHQNAAAFGMVSAMLGDHETSRLAARRLLLAASGRLPLTSEDIPSIVQSALDLTALLREHMDQEEALLFEMASGCFDDEMVQAIEAEFIEHAKVNAARSQELSDIAGTLVSCWAPADRWSPSPTAESVYTRHHVSPAYTSLLSS